ncbi:UNVERIFIED_CONTAM: hypothetical protein FKN15_034035 [Acipenser sinensis]
MNTRIDFNTNAATALDYSHDDKSILKRLNKPVEFEFDDELSERGPSGSAGAQPGVAVASSLSGSQLKGEVFDAEDFEQESMEESEISSCEEDGEEDGALSDISASQQVDPSFAL